MGYVFIALKILGVKQLKLLHSMEVVIAQLGRHYIDDYYQIEIDE
jgi:hypothetical protein